MAFDLRWGVHPISGQMPHLKILVEKNAFVNSYCFFQVVQGRVLENGSALDYRINGNYI